MFVPIRIPPAGAACVLLGILAVTLCLWARPATGAEAEGLPGYAGSDSCRDCHPKVYAQWRLTPHARMLVDAVRDPFTVQANDFGNIPFDTEDILYSVGSHWIQKYLTKVDGVLYQLPQVLEHLRAALGALQYLELDGAALQHSL